jgi:hypothetical protein
MGRARASFSRAICTHSSGRHDASWFRIVQNWPYISDGCLGSIAVADTGSTTSDKIRVSVVWSCHVEGRGVHRNAPSFFESIRSRLGKSGLDEELLHKQMPDRALIVFAPTVACRMRSENKRIFISRRPSNVRNTDGIAPISSATWSPWTFITYQPRSHTLHVCTRARIARSTLLDHKSAHVSPLNNTPR